MFAFFVHNIDPFAIRFDGLNFIDGIRWYGVCYALSFIIALYMFNVYTEKGQSRMPKEANISFVTYAILGVFIGGRVGYMLMYSLGEFWAKPLSIFAIWHGGMSSHGGFIGVVVAIFLFCRKTKIKAFELGDICASIAPVGLFLGRIANFINGELYGKITNVPWAVAFPQSDPYSMLAKPRHPSQLYEAALEGLLLFAYVQIRFWKSKKNLPHGQLSGEFLILYSALRIYVETYREVDAPLIFGLSRGQFYSLFLLIAGIFLVFYSKFTGKEGPRVEYGPPAAGGSAALRAAWKALLIKNLKKFLTKN